MDKETAAVLGQLAQLVEKLSDQIGKTAAKPSDPAVAAAPTGPVAVVEKAGEEFDSPTARNEKMRMLVEQSKNQDDFCKHAATQFGMKRTDARKYYHAHKAEAKAKAKAETPAPAPAPKAPTGEWPANPAVAIPPLVVPSTVVETPPAKWFGVSIDEIEKRVKEIIAKEGNIPAIKFIRDTTGMDLLPAKFWTDCLMDPTMAVPPILAGAKEAYGKKVAASSGTKLPSLQEQVTTIRQAEVAKAMDPEKAKAVKQQKIDIAGDNKQMLVQAARRIARELAVNGPVTIEDVTMAMSKSYNVLATKGKRHSWKGAVFATGEWVFIGDTPSKQVSSHGRPVGMWALKSWLQENTLNGKETHVSSFVISRLYSDFKRINGSKLELKDCNVYLGEERIAGEIRDTISKSGNRLYEIPVSWIPGAVGALILPPQKK